MNAATFYPQIMHALAQPPSERHQLLAGLHTESLRAYLIALDRLPSEEVQYPLPGQTDKRTIAQIVGHIAAWDRFAIQAGGDILAGIQHPRMITDLSGYREQDGSAPEFATIDDFNASQAIKYRTMPWIELHAFAVDMATTLHLLFTHPQLLSVARLERTTPYRKRLQNGTVIHGITMGWNLWLTIIEHIAIEHASLIER